jgi:hypothetical protein
MCSFGSSYSEQGTPQELATMGQQSGLFTQMLNQSRDIFGASSNVFNQLMTSFAPIVAAGPNQYGFAVPQDINLRSGAISDIGTAVKNAQQASAEQAAAVGGGNVAIPSGARMAEQARINTAGGIETARELGQITQAGYNQGRQNWLSAVQGELAAPGVFNPATQAGSAANLAGQAAFNSENALKVKQGGWGGALGGVLGNVANTFLPGSGALVNAAFGAAGADTGGGGGGGGFGGLAGILGGNRPYQPSGTEAPGTNAYWNSVASPPPSMGTDTGQAYSQVYSEVPYGGNLG